MMSDLHKKSAKNVLKESFSLQLVGLVVIIVIIEILPLLVVFLSTKYREDRPRIRNKTLEISNVSSQDILPKIFHTQIT